MPLSPGTRLGVYEVSAKIGEGGMGEVYRARDTRLDRNVALKVLPEAFTTDADRLARFEREAKVLASLNHANIGHIYGLEESGDTRALVLELVEGPTLADRIAQGPIPIADALPIATQIAEALEAAHEQGVIHRDLKPANIKVREDGTVKVLDFGLAKAFEPEASGATAGASLSPTISLTAAATQMGMVIGTAAYMAPEQAQGKPADRRADVFSFGVVLYEMLTGRRPFEGDNASLTLAAVMTLDPDLEQLPVTLSPTLRTYLTRCLAKEPSERVQAIGDVRLAMTGAFETAAGAPAVEPTLQVWQRPVVAMAVALMLVAITGLAVWSLMRPGPPAPEPVVQFAVPLGPDQFFSREGRHTVAVSPDGSQIVFVANRQLFVRRLDELQATAIPGTQENPAGPFISPDGQWVGFHAQNQLKKVALGGGAAVTLGDASNPSGASWGADDMILFSQGPEGVWELPGTGGTSEQVIALAVGERARTPQMLPGGEWVLFTLSPDDTSSNRMQIVMQSVETGERVTLVEDGQDGRYLGTGHLVYGVDGVLFAVAFDLDARQVVGGSVPLVEGVRGTGNGLVQFATAPNGTLVYVPGSAASQDLSLVWVTETGEETPTAAPARDYDAMRVSPDGTRVAAVVNGDDNTDVWIWHLDQGPLTRLTFDEAADFAPLWTPDSSRVVFSSGRDGGGLFWRAADGTGDVERLLESTNTPRSWGWTQDGRLLFDQRSGEIGVLTVEDERTVETLLETAQESEAAAWSPEPALSPDGRFLAYQSFESGRWEIFVQPFPDLDGKWQISTNGGYDPLWSPDGRTLFYLELPQRIMFSEVETDPTFNGGTPLEAFDANIYSLFGSRYFDLAPDGDRFLMARRGGSETDEADPFTGIVVVENWFEEVKVRVPVN